MQPRQPPPTDRRPSRCRGLVPAEPTPRRCPAFARRADALANHRPGRLAPDRGDDAVGRLDRPPQGCDPPTAKIGHIMPMRPRHAGGQRDPLRIGDYMMFAARFAPIGRIRTGVRPPTARTEALSTTARDPSIRSAARSGFNRIWWTRFQTPACCQARRRRQQVIPEPPPALAANTPKGCRS